MADKRTLDPIIQIDGEEYCVTTHTLTINTTKDGEPIKFDGSKNETINIPNINDFKYTSPDGAKTIITVGGIPTDKTFDSVPITEVLDMLLYPYVAPKISKVSKSASADIIEYGDDTQKLKSATITVKRGSKPIISIELKNGDDSIEKRKITTLGDISQTFDNLDITISVENNPDLKFIVDDGTIDDKGIPVTVSQNVGAATFVYPYYYGATDDGTIDSIGLEYVVPNLEKKIETRAATKVCTFNFTNKKVVFAYPKKYGTLKSILDASNFENIDSFTCLECEITGLDGSPQSYYVYVANNAASASDFKFTFKHS